MKLLRHHRRLALLISGLFFLLTASYSVVTPLFESPDEVWHYPFVWHLAREGSLPVQDPATPQLWQQEGSQPPLYYGLAALLTAPIATDDLPALIYPNPHADIGVVRPDGNANIIIHTEREQWPWRGAVLAVHIVRLFSGLLGTGTVLLTYALGRTLWPEQPALALSAMAFVAFNPMFIFISASVNNDNLITLLATLTLWGLVRLVLAPGEPGWRIFAGLGIVTGAAALAKVSGLGLVGLTGLTLLIWGFRRHSWRIALRGNLIVSLLALVIAGWWYIRNLILYGDWSGTETMIAMMGPRPIQPTFAQFLAELSGLIRSFWGLFGYFSVPLPTFVYTSFNLIFFMGMTGLILRIGKHFLSTNKGASNGAKGGSPTFSPIARTWPILIGWLIILLLGFVQWTLRTPATQGRLLFPALGVVAVLWAAGWLTLASRRLIFLPGLVMLTVATWVPWGVISPAYSHPEPVATLPATAQPLDVTFGESIRLVGYTQSQDTVRPGESLPLTLYWQNPTPLAIDYTVFVHVLAGPELVVAQRNVFHGPGVYPTSQWIPDEIIGDRYVLQLPRQTYSPSQARFEVGLYDHRTGQRLLASTGDDNIRFGQIEIVSTTTDHLPNPQQLLFEEGILLTGYDLDRQQIVPGETLTLTLIWQTEAHLSHNYKVFVHVVGNEKQRIAQHDSDPQNGAAPTGEWQPGQTIFDAHSLTVASNAPYGVYQLVVGLYDPASGQRLRLLRDGPDFVQADSITLGGVRVVRE